MNVSEMHEAAIKDIAENWEGEGLYEIAFTGGGKWTNDGPMWFENSEDLLEELIAAYACANETNLPYVDLIEQ